MHIIQMCLTFLVTTSTLDRGKPNETLFTMEESMAESICTTDYHGCC